MRRRTQIALLLAPVMLAVVAVTVGLLTGRGGDSNPPDEDTATRAYAVALDPDGRAVAAIERLERGGWRAAVARERRDGTLNVSFADVPLTGPAAIAVQDDGRLLVAGDRVVDGKRRLAVTRLTADGTLDPDFGQRGVATVRAGAGEAVARGLAIEHDRDVVLVGDATNGGGRAAIAIARVGGDGHGSNVTLIDGASAAGAATDRRGNVLVAGTDSDDGGALLARLRPGRRAAAVSRAPARLRSARWSAVAASDDGGALVVGSGRDVAGRSRIATQVFGADGAPGRAGQLIAGDGDAYGSSVLVERDGRVLVGGTGVREGDPTAFVIELVGRNGTPLRPVARAPGRLAGVLPGSAVVTTEWDGERQTTDLIR